MRMLQHYPDKVILHIARKSNSFTTTSIASTTTTSISIGTMHNNTINGQKQPINHFPLSRKCTLVKVRNKNSSIQ